MRINTMKVAVGGAVVAAAILMPISAAQAASAPHHPAPAVTGSGYNAVSPADADAPRPGYHQPAGNQDDANSPQPGKGNAHRHHHAHHRKHHKHHKPAANAPAGNGYAKPAVSSPSA